MTSAHNGRHRPRKPMRDQHHRQTGHHDYYKPPYDKKRPLYAALDLGTNNCRLMLAEVDFMRLKVVESFSEIVRLGEGVSLTGKLSDEAMHRTLEALRICARKLQDYRIIDSHFVATEACRTASNGQDFIARVKEETGLSLNVIGHKDEAVLAFLGCSPLLDSATDYALMLDIGGGSTEMMLVDMREVLSPKVLGWKSFPMGVMSSGEAHPDLYQNPDAYNILLNRLQADFADFLAPFNLPALMAKNHLQMICCSGTVTTLGALYQKLPRYDRRQVDGVGMDVSGALDVIHMLLQSKPEQLRLNPCIGNERADYLLPGCSILHAAFAAAGVKRITVADRGVREGILFSLFQKNNHKHQWD